MGNNLFEEETINLELEKQQNIVEKLLYKGTKMIEEIEKRIIKHKHKEIPLDSKVTK